SFGKHSNCSSWKSNLDGGSIQGSGYCRSKSVRSTIGSNSKFRCSIKSINILFERLTMGFKAIFDQYNWEEVEQRIYASTENDVRRALSKTKRDLNDFAALISPAAAPFWEQMAQMSHALTQKRFGKTIQLYAPMYLSNECNNICTYGGFSLDNKIRRKTLNPAEIKQEMAVIK